MAKLPPISPRGEVMMRGSKEPSSLGSLTYIALRSADVLLQYSILHDGLGSSLLHRLGIDTVPSGPPARTGLAALDALDLSPYRLLLLAMATGAAMKHIFWLTVTSEETWPVSTAVAVSVYHSLIDSVNSMLCISAIASGTRDRDNLPRWHIIVGTALFVFGLAGETIAEVQRKAFKKRPENKGKPCTQGFWSVVRHPKYAGYILWRSGYALVGGGWIWASIEGIAHVLDFSQRAIPLLDDYCAKRYGPLWLEYKRRTRFRLFPGL